jgi:hypothetical protein
MHKLAQAMVERFATRFNAGDHLSMTEDFVFPLPVQVKEQLALIHRPADMVALLECCRTAIAPQGPKPSHPRIVAIDLPRRGRFRLWVDWSCHARPTPDQVHTKNIYYCSVIGSRIQVDMVQYLQIADEGSLALSAFAERRSA